MENVIYGGWYLSTGAAVSFCPKHLKLASREAEYAPICCLGPICTNLLSGTPWLQTAAYCLAMIGRFIPRGCGRSHVVSKIWRVPPNVGNWQGELFEEKWPETGGTLRKNLVNRIWASISIIQHHSESISINQNWSTPISIIIGQHQKAMHQ